MKRAAIIIGLVILLALMLFWGYVLIFGAPKSITGMFAELGLQDPTEITPDTPTDPTGVLALPNAALNQLTMKAIAGFVSLPPDVSVVATNTSTPALGRIVYAERGTGHIYELDLDTGSETRRSSVTVGQTVAAYFNLSGSAVVIVAEAGDTTSATLYGLDEPAEKEITLPPASRNIAFTSDLKLRYSTIEDTATVAYEYDRATGATTELWRVPLTDIDITWTDRGAYVVNRPAPNLRSGVYQVQNGALQPVVAAKPALSAIIDPTGQFIFYSALRADIGGAVSTVLDQDNGQETASAQSFIPGKCVRQNDTIWCATSYELSHGDMELLAAWHRGELLSDDRLWFSKLSDNRVTLAASLSKLAGVTIDVTNLTLTYNRQALVFLNKINDTLWLYRLPVLVTDAAAAQTPAQ